MAVEIEQRPEEAHRLTDDRCQSGAKGTHAQQRHKHQVQHQIDHGSNGNENKWVLGVTHASENGTDQVIAIDEHQSQHTGQTVLPGIIKALLRRIHCG